MIINYIDRALNLFTPTIYWSILSSATGLNKIKDYTPHRLINDITISISFQFAKQYLFSNLPKLEISTPIKYISDLIYGSLREDDLSNNVSNEKLNDIDTKICPNDALDYFKQQNDTNAKITSCSDLVCKGLFIGMMKTATSITFSTAYNYGIIDLIGTELTASVASNIYDNHLNYSFD